MRLETNFGSDEKMVIFEGETQNDPSIRNHVFSSSNAHISLFEYGIDRHRHYEEFWGVETSIFTN